jgi:hypothetical protein
MSIRVPGRQCAALPARGVARGDALFIGRNLFAGVIPMRETRRVASVSMGKPFGLRTRPAAMRLPIWHRTPLSKMKARRWTLLFAKQDYFALHGASGVPGYLWSFKAGMAYSCIELGCDASCWCAGEGIAPSNGASLRASITLDAGRWTAAARSTATACRPAVRVQLPKRSRVACAHSFMTVSERLTVGVPRTKGLPLAPGAAICASLGIVLS